MDGVLAITCVVLTWLAGFGLVELLQSSREPRSFVHHSALGWMLGTFWVTVWLAVLGVLVQGVGLLLSVTILSSVPAYFGLRQFFRRRPRNPVLQFSVSPVVILLAFFAAIQIFVVIWRCFASSNGWDGMVVWLVKARILFLNEGAMPAASFLDEGRAFSHPEYPLFYPYLQYWISAWVSDLHQFWCKLPGIPFVLAAWGFLYTGAKCFGCSRVIAFAVSCGFFLISGLVLGEPGIAQGYPDFICAAFYAGALVELLSLKSSSDRFPGGLVLGLMLAALPWIKQDGMVLYGTLVIGGIVARFPRIGLRDLVWIAPGLMVIAAWKIAIHMTGMPDPGTFAGASIAKFAANFSRLDVLLPMLTQQFVMWQFWSILWPLTAIAIVCLFFRGHRQIAFLLAIAVVLPICLFLSSYVLSNWDYIQHARTSLNRILVHSALAGFLSICLAVADAFRAESPVSPLPKP